MIYDATEKPKGVHQTLVFVFKTCCFSDQVKRVSEEFESRELKRNVNLLIAAPVVSGFICVANLLHYSCWLSGDCTVGS